MATTRRRFLGTWAATLGTIPLARLVQGAESTAAKSVPAKPERLRIGAIGMRYQGSVITRLALEYGDLVAICDVDRHVREQARASFGSRAAIYEDYRDLLKRKDVDVVLIATPDHWHTKMVIDACRAGKDVYCEKPLTLTIDEGKQLRQVVSQTGRVVQVGSWQRSDFRFRQAVEMVRQGRLGQLKTVEVVLGKNPQGGPFAPSQPPRHFNWDLWQGQTPAVPYIEERAHYTFRWWLEYSGGELTDAGAHDIDIAQWAIGSLPVTIDGKASYPETANGYNVPITYAVRYVYANGVELKVSDSGRAGILFTGSEGRIFVNRGSVEGKPVEEMGSRPLDREDFVLYANDNLARPPRMGKLDAIVNHMGNFFDCIESRRPPLSDIESQHRSVSTCHLGNISMRLGRPLQWDAQQEQFVGDADANRLLSRPQRPGYETTA